MMRPSESVVVRWGGPIAIVCMAIGMAAWTWGTWPDVLVDFGRELYVAWQLASGKTLYVDIAYVNGPLSPYVNALWFRLFGVGLNTLIICNLAILVGLVCLLYRILEAISDQRSATYACLTFLMLFAFGQFVEIGNYNYVCPYSHEVTHGVVLSLVSVYCLSTFPRRHRPASLLGTGAALGLVFLTKPEVFVAASLAVAGGIGAIAWAERASFRRLVGVSGLVIGAALIPPLVTWGLFSRVMPMDQAVRAVVGAWPWVFTPEIRALDFYRWVMGVNDLAGNVKVMLTWAGWYMLIFLPAAGLSLVLRTPDRHRRWIAGALFVAIVGVLGYQWYGVRWVGSPSDAFRPLPLVMLILGGVTFVSILRRRLDRDDVPRAVLRLMMAVFAFVLMGKMMLNVHLYHYGFVLAMPATLLLVAILLGWVPDYLARKGGDGRLFRTVGLAVLVAVVFSHLQTLNFWIGQKQYPVSAGDDVMLADARAIAVNAALEEITRLPQGATLAVLPEGVMLNYLTRRVNPTPYITFMPPEVIMFGEARMLSAFEADPPDYIALVHKSTAEYGFRFFGVDYGQRIASWIAEHYREVILIGAPPLRDRRFGIRLLRFSG